MGSKSRVKGIVVEIGGDTTGLDKALQGTNKNISHTQGQLRDVERLLKLDPTNTNLLAQKQRLLAEAVSETRDKLDVLKEAEKQVQQQFEKGEIAQDQYDALQREIADTSIKLRNLEDKAAEAAHALKAVDEDPVEEVADAARDAEDALDDAGKEAADFGDVLKANLVSDAASDLVDSLKDVVSESKEYRKIMGSLEVSSEKAGYSAEETAEAYKSLYGVLADDQTTATTVANLQALKLDQEKLNELINGAVGAWAEYGDSIPIDGLAEAINETVKTGKVTGNLADVLNWGAKEGENYGVAMREATEENEAWNQSVAAAASAEDFFNLALQDCTSEAERANLVLQMLSDQGLTNSGAAWRENNASLVESNEAQARMNEQIAGLGELIEPVFTKVVNVVADALEWFNSLDSNTQTLILTFVALLAGMGPLMAGVNGVIGVFSSLDAMLTFLETVSIASFIIAIAAFVALIAVYGDEIQSYLQALDDFLQGVFLTDWTEVFGPGLGGVLNDFCAILKAVWDSIYQIFNGVIDFIRGVFTGDWDRAWNGVASIFKGIFDGLVAIAKAPINGIISLVNGAISGINGIIDTLNYIPGVNIGYISKIPYLAKGGEVIDGDAVVGEAGPELLTVSGGRTIVRPLTNNTHNRTTNWGGVQVNVYGAPGQSEDELADRVMEKFQQVVDAKEAGLA